VGPWSAAVDLHLDRARRLTAIVTRSTLTSLFSLTATSAIMPFC
jgi:hypothetical protein